MFHTNSRSLLQHEQMLVIIQLVLPYSVGGSSSTEDCDLRLHKEILFKKPKQEDACYDYHQ